MRIPKMSGGSQYRVTVPALDGGVNLKDAPNLVEDNQLTDVLNMWWKDQALRTRPGLRATECGVGNSSIDREAIIGTKDFKGYKNEGFDTYGEEDFYRSVCVFDYYEDDDTYRAVMRNLFYDGTICWPFEDSIGGKSIYKATAMYIESKGILLFSDGNIYHTPTKYDQPYTDMKPHIYAPLVLMNGIGAASIDAAAVTGTMFESYNMLTPRFRCQYTTDGKGIYFFLPEKYLNDTDIQVSYTTHQGEMLEFTIPAGAETSNTLSGISVGISRRGGYFWFKNTSGPFACPSAGFSSNVEITVEKDSEENLLKICGMQFYTWFGGDSDGINGGSRLFVSGNPNEPNLVYWSDVDNPLYFPENNCVRVGDAGEAVTAFGRQNDMLVIFKDREIFYAAYAAGNSYTAQDVIDGKVTDVSASSAYFPVTQISSNVGCDCPDTIQLCNNRLVWATSEGKVYVLATANQYNERNAYELSGMIRPDLLKIPKEKWAVASAGDYCNHYALLVDNQMYLFDYGVSAFVNASAYSRDENLQKNICWYKWDIGIDGIDFIRFLARDTRGVLIGNLRDESGIQHDVLYTLGEGEDMVPRQVTGTWELEFDSRPILSRFQTKVFDFGQPERRKKIRRLHIGATDTAGDAISLSYVTEQEVREDALRLGAYGTGEMREWCVTPGVNRVRQFGIRAESKGAMAVDNMTLKYEVNGEVR